MHKSVIPRGEIEEKIPSSKWNEKLKCLNFSVNLNRQSQSFQLWNFWFIFMKNNNDKGNCLKFKRRFQREMWNEIFQLRPCQFAEIQTLKMCSSSVLRFLLSQHYKKLQVCLPANGEPVAGPLAAPPPAASLRTVRAQCASSRCWRASLASAKRERERVKKC